MSDSFPKSDRPLRVGIITDGLKEGVRPDGSPRIANGGVGVYIYNLVKHLQQLEDGPELVLMRCGRGELDIYEGPRTTSVFLPCSPWNRIGRWLDLPYRKVVREHRLDVVHHPNQFGGVFLPKSVKQVVTLHDITPVLMPEMHQWKTVLRYRHIMRRSLRQAARIITDSTSTRDDVLAHALAPAEKLSVVPLGAAPIFQEGVRSEGFEASYAPPERFILSVGVLEPRKNHGLLVESLAQLRAQGHAVGLVIVGRHGWGWTHPCDDPQYARLRPWVQVHEDVPDAHLAEFYGRATVVAYPSVYEGFGLPMLEAMACGTALVASNTSSLPGVAKDAAIFADPQNPAAFADVLGRVLNDDTLRAELAAAGRARVESFSWHRTAVETARVYQEVCAVAAPAHAEVRRAPVRDDPGLAPAEA